ncbi:MAG: YopX family protein [Candidatus Omnitrophota bacterium]
MRPIKFRAWNGNKKIIDGNCVIRDGDSYPMFVDEVGIKKCGAEFEQFTGLLDKNGKEIYEGDIVLEVVDSGPEEIKRYDEFLGVVVYDRNGFGIQTEGMRDGETEVPLWGMDDGWVEIEVLGNIHEQPELLEAKSEK